MIALFIIAERYSSVSVSLNISIVTMPTLPGNLQTHVLKKGKRKFELIVDSHIVQEFSHKFKKSLLIIGSAASMMNTPHN